MNVPDWMVDAADQCPHEAAQVAEANAAIDALAKTCTDAEFMTRYQAMLDSRDRLYDAWIALQMDEA